MPNVDEVLFAEPGDIDIDVDVNGMILTSIIATDSSVLIHFKDGHGNFFDPGEHTGTEVTGINGSIGFNFDEHGDNTEVITMYLEKLEPWRANETPLRMLCAPGKMTTLIETRNNWLPLPRVQLELS